MIRRHHAITLQQANFDVLVTWLGALEREKGIRVRQLDIRAAGEAGAVDGTIVLQ